MTLLMVWREGPADRLWIVSDSRLSGNGPTGGTSRYTDRAAKILEAHLHLQGLNPNQPPLQSRTVGFAYTGSTLIALEAYTAVLPLWPRLMSSGEQVLPTMRACAENLGLFLKEYAFDVAGGAGGEITTECVLLGCDDQSPAVQAWKVRVAPSLSGIDLSVSEIVLGDGEMALFGSGAADAKERLCQRNPNGRPWRREPLDMLREQLREDEPGAVGGGVQVGFAEPDGFHLSADAQPFQFGGRFGGSFAIIRFRGFDLEQVGRVGHAFVSLAAIAG